jgi:hypothetical protein
MLPQNKQHLKILREKHRMAWIEIWRDAMCGEMPTPEKGKCLIPDGLILRGYTCKGCRYSNYRW